MRFKQVQRFIYAFQTGAKIYLCGKNIFGLGALARECETSTLNDPQYKLVRQSQIVQRAIDGSGKIGCSSLLKVFFCSNKQHDLKGR